MDHIEWQNHVPIVVLPEKEDVDEDGGKGEGEVEKADHPDEGLGIGR
jgi:hypothetical protein